MTLIYENDECDVDEFILFYIKSSIEYDNKYLWFDAPLITHCSNCNKCQTVYEAALYFEHQKLDIVKELIISLIDYNQLTFQSYKCIFDIYIDSITDLISDLQIFQFTISPYCIPLLVIIVFTGAFARRLIELDYGEKLLILSDKMVEKMKVNYPNYEREGSLNFKMTANKRDYRRELYQLSLYASQMLERQLIEFEKFHCYSWVQFTRETMIWMNNLKEYENKEKKKLQTHFKLTPTFLKYFTTGAFLAIGCILIYNRTKISFNLFSKI